MKITKLETFLVKTALALSQNAHRRGPRRSWRTHPRRTRPHLRPSRSRTRTLSHRQRPPARGTPLAGHVSPCIFIAAAPILTSALSGVEQALWDLAGKAADMPVYEMLGGPLRDRIKMYKGTGGGGTPEQAAAAVKERKKQGFIAIKTGPAKIRPARIVENPAFIDHAVETFAAMREAGGPDFDIAIDFHGAISPQTAAILIKALEPYQPMFVEETHPSVKT